MTDYNHRVRRTLAEYGWLNTVRTELRTQVEMSELYCPECDSKNVILWDSEYSTKLRCMDCEHSDKISNRELIDDE